MMRLPPPLPSPPPEQKRRGGRERTREGRREGAGRGMAEGEEGRGRWVGVGGEGWPRKTRSPPPGPGLWSMIPGLWLLVPVPWAPAHGPWSLVSGSWSLPRSSAHPLLPFSCPSLLHSLPSRASPSPHSLPPLRPLHFPPLSPSLPPSIPPSPHPEFNRKHTEFKGPQGVRGDQLAPTACRNPPDYFGGKGNRDPQHSRDHGHEPMQTYTSVAILAQA
jgi:hypothetical protein